MSSDCNRQLGKGGKIVSRNAGGNDYGGGATNGGRRELTVESVGNYPMPASHLHLHLAGQEWNMETQLRPPRNKKKGNLERDNKGRKDPRGSNVTSVQASQLPTHQPVKSSVFQSDAEASGVSHSLGARPKLFPRQTGSGGQQTPSIQVDKESTKSKFVCNSGDKQVNSNEISKKLKQVRDYINQITSTIEAMENLRDPNVSDKLERLRGVRTDLVDNEQQLLELLDRISVLSREAADDQRAITDASYLQENRSLNNEEYSDASAESEDEDENETNDASSGNDFLLKRNELLKKMADSQERLKALQDHQAMLLTLKRRVEGKLSDTRAMHEVLNRQTTELGPEELNRDERPQPVGHHQAQENRQRRFPASHDDRGSHEGHEVNLADEDQLTDIKYQEIEKKWLSIQKERDQIDLLRELHLLQDNRMVESTSLAGDKLAAFEQNCSKGKRNSIPRVIAGDSECAAGIDKTKKVEDKKWFKSLQGVESNAPRRLSASNHGDYMAKPCHSDFVSDAMRDEQQSRLKKTRKTKKSNLSYNKDDNDFSANTSDNREMSASDLQNRLDYLISELHIDVDDGHYDERTKKLYVAKTKLQKLQGIISLVQQAQQDGETISAEYIDQLLETVDNEELPKENPHSNQRLKNQTSAVQSFNPKDANDNKPSRKFQFDNPRQTQRMDPVGMNDSRRESNSSHDVGSVPHIEPSRDSNGDFWLDMKRQLSLTEELRHRRRELESLMQKDAGKSYLLNQDIKEENHSAKSEPLRKSATASVVADSMSAATWGGSSFDNETQETIDGTNDSQEEKTEIIEDEEYSSDGPIAVNGYEGNGHNDQFESRSSKVTNRISPVVLVSENRRLSRTNPAGAVTDLATGDSSSSSVRKRSIQVQLPSHPQEQLLDGSSNMSVFEDQTNSSDQVKVSTQNGNAVGGAMSGLQAAHPIEATAMLYQTFLCDQSVMDGLARQSLLPNNNVPIAPFHSSDVYNSQQSQLQQQMLLGLSQCYKLLYLQNVETHRLQQLLQGYLPNIPGTSFPEACMPCHGTNSCDTTETHPHAASQWHRDTAAVSAASHGHRISTTLPLSSTIPDSHETLNNQVPPGNRANNYWDNFRSYSRQNLLSTAHHLNKSNDGMGRLGCQGDLHLKAHVVNVSESHEPIRQPALIQEHVETNDERVCPEHAKCSPRGSRSSDLRELSEPCVIHNPSKNKVNKEQRNQLSNNISSYNPSNAPNAKSVINCGNVLNNSSSNPSHSGCNLAMAKPTTVTSSSLGLERSFRREGGGGAAASSCEISSSNSQLEGEIQTVVNKLISRCSGESDVIVDLLRELQKLKSQQEFNCALIAIRNFVSDNTKYQSEAGAKTSQVHPKESSSSDEDVEMRTVHHQSYMPKQERLKYVVEQESSSDDDLYPHWAQLKKNRQFNDPGSFGGASSERLKSRNQPYAASGDLKASYMGNKKYQNKSAGVNRKLFKNRTGSSAQSSSNSIHQPEDPQLVASIAEDCSAANSVADADVVTSSDVPQFSRFDVRQLENQMQDVVASVTSFVALLSSRQFNSTLMGIVTSRMIDLVLSMVDNLNEYTMSFVPGHLESVLSNILPKYYGKRVSECESNLVTELSEILFNELALLQLMQNMVNGNKSLKLSCQPLDNERTPEQRNQSLNAAAAHEAQSADVSYHAASHLKGAFAEATDADLVLTTKRGDDDDNDKSKEEFSCDIPDVCVSHENVGAMYNEMMDEMSPPIFRSINEVARLSPSSSSASHRDSHNPTVLQLPELGNGITGSEEVTRYFDLEVELEEGLGDTQDLAEADQSHRYMGLESLDDDARDECVENWPLNHNFCNGDIERAEDDQQDENGAVGGVSAPYQNTNSVESIPTRMEAAVLDEVPIKLRVGGSGGGGSGQTESENDCTRKADGSTQEKQS
ncbi:Phosphoacetylglucosamine Mutase [Chamberlinius hualienensis]